MSGNQQELPPLYEAPRKGTILGYNLWSAHPSRKPLQQISSGGKANANIWALSAPINDVCLLSRWNPTTGEWIEYTNFCHTTKSAISFSSICAGPNQELWAIDRENCNLYRRILSYNEMKKGIYLAEWELIETGNIKFSTICMSGLKNVWAISYDPDIDQQKTVLFHLEVKLHTDKVVHESTQITGLLGEEASYSWHHIVVNKKLSKISVNENGDMWAIDYCGKLFHRITEHKGSDPSFQNAYEPEELSGPGENFFLLPGEDLDTAVWRQANPFKFSCLEEHDNFVSYVCVGRRSVWCIDNEGKMYLRTGTNFFRRVTGLTEAEEFMDKLKGEKQSLSQSTQNFHWRQVSTLRYPHVVKPNPTNAAFEKMEQVPDFRQLVVKSIHVNGDDVVNAVSISGNYWFRLRPQKLTIITANDYKKIWDDRGTGVPEDIGIWRARPLTDYKCLGDFAERSHLSYPLTHNFESPNFVVLCASENSSQYENLGPEDKGFESLFRLLVRPVTYKRIWDDRSFGSRNRYGPVTIWTPVPPSTEYAALGCVATPVSNLKEGSVPEGELVYCVHKSVLLGGLPHPSSGKFTNQSLWSTELQSGKTDYQASFWEVTGIRNEGTSSGSFLALPTIPFKRANDTQLFVLNIARTSTSWD